jgi:citronellol/citronellal dehydrogenase
LAEIERSGTVSPSPTRREPRFYGEETVRGCRRPEILADAAHAILVRPAATTTGRFFIDEEVLAAEGVTDFGPYAVAPGAPLLPDLFL